MKGTRITVRNNHRRCSVKKGVPRNFAKFTGKYLCQSLFFKKVAGLSQATLSKKRLWHRCFTVHFTKFWGHLFYRTPLWVTAFTNKSEKYALYWKESYFNPFQLKFLYPPSPPPTLKWFSSVFKRYRNLTLG